MSYSKPIGSKPNSSKQPCLNGEKCEHFKRGNCRYGHVQKSEKSEEVYCLPISRQSVSQQCNEETCIACNYGSGCTNVACRRCHGVHPWKIKEWILRVANWKLQPCHHGANCYNMCLSTNCRDPACTGCHYFHPAGDVIDRIEDEALDEHNEFVKANGSIATPNYASVTAQTIQSAKAIPEPTVQSAKAIHEPTVQSKPKVQHVQKAKVNQKLNPDATIQDAHFEAEAILQNAHFEADEIENAAIAKAVEIENAAKAKAVEIENAAIARVNAMFAHGNAVVAEALAIAAEIKIYGPNCESFRNLPKTLVNSAENSK